MRSFHDPHSPDVHFSKLHWPGAVKKEVSRPMHLLNKVLNKMGVPLWLVPRFDPREEMVSMEQVVNFQHLITRVLDHEVSGDMVELGCYTGSTSAIIGTLLREAESDRAFHVYDSFEHNLSREKIDVLSCFVENMKMEDLELPFIHQGDLYESIPDQLPLRIAFAHIDLGTGGDPKEHGRCLIHSLEHIYDRLSHGGICMLMDYHDPATTIQGADHNPGVRLACNEFFKDRPEQIITLFGGPCSHAYFKKM